MHNSFLRCEYCGNTYRNDREYCPHCMAPRPEELVEDARPEELVEDATVFYADNKVIYTSRKPVIPPTYGTVSRK